MFSDDCLLGDITCLTHLHLVVYGVRTQMLSCLTLIIFDPFLFCIPFFSAVLQSAAASKLPTNNVIGNAPHIT